MAVFFSHYYIGNLIIPTDELIYNVIHAENATVDSKTTDSCDPGFVIDRNRRSAGRS